MKKIYPLLLLALISTFSYGQVLNQPANWPNTDWTVTGTFNTDPTAFEADPTVTANFAFDDDDAGSGSDDDIAAESPIIDLTAAFNAGETWLFLNTEFTYNALGDTLTLEYWDSDAASWVTWEQFLETTDTPTDEFCSGVRDSFESQQLNIGTFTATQQAGFRYRISFLDDGGAGGAGFQWGFCFDAPTITSQTPPTCPDLTNLAVANVTGTSVDISWSAGNTETEWEYVVQTAGTGEPTGAGTSTNSNTLTVDGLDFATDYEVYVRGNCDADGFSNWIGPVNFTTTIQSEYDIDCNGAPTNIQYCYGNNDTTTWLFTSTDSSPLRVTFNSGTIEGNFDFVRIYDGTSNADPLLFESSEEFGVIDLTGVQESSTGDSLFIEVNSDSSVSCESGARDEWDFTVVCATCANPTVTYTVNEDCINGPQFFVDVDLTDLGSATSITLSDNQGSAPQTTSATGQFSFGPYTNNTDVQITVANDDDTNCILTSDTLTQEICVLNTVDCAVGPTNVQYCYTDNDTTTWLFTSTDGSALRIAFDSGTIEGFFDFLRIYDGSNNTGTLLFESSPDFGTVDLAGLIFQSTLDSMYLEVTSDSSVSCDSGAQDQWNFNVSCATCINPTANYLVVDDCENGDQFLIDVDITSIGDATSLTISDNQGSAPVQVTSTGTTQFGPYPFLTNIVITIANDDDPNCIINSGPIQQLACPPDNDNCDTATIANVNPNDSCDILNAGSIIAASASNVPNGSCIGNPDNDVWFEFVALDVFQLISIQNSSNPATNFDHAVYEGSCDDLVEVYCNDQASSITPELIIGNTYYIRIFSAGTDDDGATFDLCINKAPDNVNCENASNFCSAGEALVGSNVIGLPDDTDVACLGSIPNPSWNVIQIGDSGTVEIQIAQNTEFDDDGNPIGTPLDVDFVLWGPFDPETNFCELDLLVDCPSCPNNTADPNFYPFDNIIDCSYDPADIENLTIDNALNGELYVLLVTNFSNQAGIIQITQTNEGEEGSGSITAEIEVALSVDGGPCGFPEQTINADSPFADEFQWFKDGVLIDDETGNSITVTESGTYLVTATDLQCDATATDEIVVRFYTDANANPVEDIVTCDDVSLDGIENFDLEIQTPGILGSQDPDAFVVTYHLSFNDAGEGINALSSPYTNISNPQTIHARIIDVNAVDDPQGCFARTSFDLVVSDASPNATSVDFEICDDVSGDGIELFDLDSHSANILNGQDSTVFNVTYHDNQVDADAGNNPLTSPYQNTSNPQTIYARVESNQAFDCYATTAFNLILTDLPSTSFESIEPYEVCPNATVPIEIVAIPQNYSEANAVITWYLDNVIITGENTLILPVLTQGTYTIEITNNTTGCTGVASTTVTELENCVIPSGISPNGDDKNQNFDLSSFNVDLLEVFDRYGAKVYSKRNYTNEWEGQNENGDRLPVGTYFYVMHYDDGERKADWIYVNY